MTRVRLKLSSSKASGADCCASSFFGTDTAAFFSAPRAEFKQDRARQTIRNFPRICVLPLPFPVIGAGSRTFRVFGRDDHRDPAEKFGMGNSLSRKVLRYSAVGTSWLQGKAATLPAIR